MAGLLWYRSYMDSLANKSGYYPDIHAGHADRVTELTLEAPYLVRESPAGYNRLELAQIIGGTVDWNQLCNSSSVTGTSGHKFYLKKSGVESITNTNTFTGLASGTDMVTDLTQMFGSTLADYVYSLEQATAGSGIQWLKDYDLIDDQYHAYSQGSLESVNVSAHVTVGKNMLDKSEMNYMGSNAYIGSTNVNTGADGSFVLPAGSYVFSVSGVNTVQALYVINSSNTNIAARYNNTVVAFTLTETAAIKLMIYKNNANAEILAGYNYQLEMGTAATAYAPYIKRTYPFGTTTLRGIPMKDADGNLYYDGDTYEWDGTVTRKYVEITITSAMVSNVSTTSTGVQSAVVSLNPSSVDESNSIAIAEGYVLRKGVPPAGNDKEFRVIATDAYFYDARFTDLDTAKSILNGVKMCYNVATPTTESADPFTAVQTVEDGGTEEFVTTNGVPVGNVSIYRRA